MSGYKITVDFISNYNQTQHATETSFSHIGKSKMSFLVMLTYKISQKMVKRKFFCFLPLW